MYRGPAPVLIVSGPRRQRDGNARYLRAIWSNVRVARKNMPCWRIRGRWFHRLDAVSPPDLALKLRVAISSTRSRNSLSLFQRCVLRLENTFQGFMVPATAGVVSAVIFLGSLMVLLVPAQVSANDDVPSTFYTPPRLQVSEYPENQLSLDSPVVIETYVDTTGRVENFRIISGRDDEEVRAQLNRALLFTIFVPAQSFGRPVPGKAIMSFSHINVKG